MRTRLTAVAGTAVILAAMLAGCSKTTNDNGPTKTVAQQAGGVDMNPKDSMGPATAVAGATQGGTVTIIRESDLNYIDPARNYTLSSLTLGQLVERPLTEWKQDAKGGLTLVGDTATTPGTDVNKDCKAWRFTIKPGLKFEDGTAITAKDIAYGIARSFDIDLGGGPTYIQSWLADNPQYQDVWNFQKNKTSLPPGLTVPDPMTLQMQFQKPHCDLPFATSLPETSPVPAAKDTGVNYDSHPVSSGPYMYSGSYVRGKGVTLVRNPNWNASTDAVNHAYPNSYVVQIGPSIDAATNRMIADAGADQTAISYDGVASDLTAKVLGNASMQSRMVNQPTPDLWVLSINNQRVTDLSVRQALNYAIDRQDFLKADGGPTFGTPVTTLLPPQTLGFTNYDAYPAGPTGDIEKAKQLLAGKHPTLVLGVASGGVDDDITEIKNNLEKAGFKIIIRQDSGDTFFSDRERKDNPWDLYLTDWIYDWPSGSSVIPLLYDGRSIRATSNLDTAYVNAPDVNSEIDRVQALQAAQQGSQWAALDKTIMTKYAPVVPMYVSQAFYVWGSKIGGLYVSGTTGEPAFANAYVKP